MKTHIRSGWTKIPNALLEDVSLSSDGLRVICWIISHNGSYVPTRVGISKALGFGEHKMRKAIGGRPASNTPAQHPRHRPSLTPRTLPFTAPSSELLNFETVFSPQPFGRNSTARTPWRN